MFDEAPLFEIANDSIASMSTIRSFRGIVFRMFEEVPVPVEDGQHAYPYVKGVAMEHPG